MKFGGCLYLKYHHASCRGTETRFFFFFFCPPECSILSPSFPQTQRAWLQAVSAASPRSSVVLSQSVLFIKVLNQLHRCSHSEKERLKHTTIHSQNGWYKMRSILTGMKGHHGADWHCSSCNGISDGLENTNYISVMVWQRWCWD